jgi:UDP-glucose 4-epimerase
VPSADSVLVTGGFGFVGSRLVARLVEAGERVVALDDGSLGRPDSLPPEAEPVLGDVRDTDSLRSLVARVRPRWVFHLAALHFVPACEADPPRAFSVNVVGTQSLLSALEREQPPESLVLASTGAVYSPSSEPHAEDSPTEPTDVYGLSKLWSEQAVRLHRRRAGTAVGIARLFNVIGPGETNPHLVPELVAQARAGGELRLGDLSTRRDYVFVDDVAAGLVDLAAVAPREGLAVCNLGTGSAVDGHELVRVVGDLLGRELTVATDPERLRPGERPVLASDPSLAEDLLGWRARTELRGALAEALERPLAAA